MTESLFKDFYTILAIQKTGEDTFESTIRLNPQHAIFEGHFPGNPITPGVCMMQIIKEITENYCEQSLQLQTANNVKFMAIINPFENPELLLSFSLNETAATIKVKNTTTFGDTIALKLSVTYLKK